MKGTIITITSGKGGVGKTTIAANISLGLALKGKETVAVDMDIGLRNLDMILGLENRIVYDIVNVMENEAKLSQALIRDKRTDKLHFLPASLIYQEMVDDCLRRLFSHLKSLSIQWFVHRDHIQYPK